MNKYRLKIGDLIVRQKGPLSTHYIVYAGLDNGIEIVAENQNGIGVRFTTLVEALAGNPVVRIERFGGNDSERRLVIPKIKQLLGRDYNLVNFNCEHFARWIANGKLESKQVQVASGISIVGGLMLLGTNNETTRTIGVVGVLAGIFAQLSQFRQ